MMKIISLALTCVLLFSPALIAELSEADIEDIVERYADACIKRDYKAWLALSYDNDRVSEQDFTRATHFAEKVRKIRIKDIEGLNVKIKISNKPYDSWLIPTKEEGWLQLLPDGKIKYDLICEHPIIVAFKCYSIIPVRCHNKRCNSKTNEHDRDCSRKRMFDRLKATGIPLFGYELSASPFDQKSSRRKIKAWLKENGAHWDKAEPKVDCPYRQFQEYKSRWG